MTKASPRLGGARAWFIWAIGVLVGINLLMTGISLVAVASTLRGLKRLAQEQVEPPVEQPAES